MDVTANRSIQGFSLVELVILILIISVLAVVINITWPGSSLNLGAQTSQLASDLRYTQTLSMTRGQRFCLKISGSTYQVINSGTSTAVYLGSGKTTTTLDSGISFGTLAPSGAALYIYDGDGIPYTSTSTTCSAATAQAATALTANGSIPLIASGQTRTILISPDTGRVIIQ